MDLFTFYPPSSVLICKPCRYAVSPTSVPTHVRTHHPEDARHAATTPSGHARNSANLLATYLCQQYQLLDPATAHIPTPHATSLLILDLTLYSGYQCTCSNFVLRSGGKEAKASMEKHFNKHRLAPRKPGGQEKMAGIPAKDSGPVFTMVSSRYITMTIEGSVELTANHRQCSIIPLPSASPHQNP